MPKRFEIRWFDTLAQYDNGEKAGRYDYTDDRNDAVKKAKDESHESLNDQARRYAVVMTFPSGRKWKVRLQPPPTCRRHVLKYLGKIISRTYRNCKAW